MSDVTFYLDAILSVEEDAITIVNNKKEVLYWNNAAISTYNIEREKIIGKNITQFFHNDDLMVLRVLRTKEAIKNTYHRPRIDKHVVINASPVLDENKNVIGAVSIERDISHIVKLNDNLSSTSKELLELRQKVYTEKENCPFSKLKGSSSALQQTITIAEKAAKTDATTLILGDSGTGKEICAQAIHESSSRRNKPFIPVNCGAIPSALFESELFGYEGGAFTGAEKKGKAGKIEMANGGTLFLDEVGELPLDMQVKLLRVLQENTLYRIGDTNGRKIDVRFIAATNQNLELLMRENKFRSDLFYRLNVIQIVMPPLRNRADDVLELFDFFLEQFAQKYKTPTPQLENNAKEVLTRYEWPGNVRELRNLAERLVILSENNHINKEDLERLMNRERLPQTSVVSFPHLPKEKEHIEKQLIKDVLVKVNGNKSAAAKKLGISRVTLYKKLKKYGINDKATL